VIAMTAKLPPNVRARWYEIWVDNARGSLQGHRLDGRRRTKETAERIAAELRASKNYHAVWLVEVNRLKRSPA
jgi:hypothetical protein